MTKKTKTTTKKTKRKNTLEALGQIIEILEKFDEKQKYKIIRMVSLEFDLDIDTGY